MIARCDECRRTFDTHDGGTLCCGCRRVVCPEHESTDHAMLCCECQRFAEGLHLVIQHSEGPWFVGMNLNSGHRVAYPEQDPFRRPLRFKCYAVILRDGTIRWPDLTYPR